MFAAGHASAPAFGCPVGGNRERRREPRAAHSLGVWQGESVAARLAWSGRRTTHSCAHQRGGIVGRGGRNLGL
jgi:hypothetical protein